jgi:hypothetical protein
LTAPVAALAPTRADTESPRADRSELSDNQRRAVTAILVCTVGYLVGGKSFAYMGLPQLNLFVGEIGLVVAVVYAPTRLALLETLHWLVTPSRFHVLAWCTLLFLLFGAAELARGVAYGYPPLDALKTFAFNYYALFLVLGLWAQRHRPDFLERCVMAVAWGNAIWGPLFLFVFQPLHIYVPGAMVLVSGGTASAIALVGMLCFDRRLAAHWYLIVANVFILLAFQIRAEWLAVIPMMVVWGLLRRRLRIVLVGVLALVLALSVLALANVTLPSAGGRGGEVSLVGITGRLIAPFDEERAAQLLGDGDADAFAGTASWRTTWWTNIREGVNASDDRWLLGYGYGFELRTLAPFVEEGVRTPHSVFHYTLGYSGWVGVFVFALFYGTIGVYLRRAQKVDGQPFGLCLWVGVLVLASFGNWFEAPFGAIPMYVLLGASLAPLLGRTDASLPAERSVRG